MAEPDPKRTPDDTDAGYRDTLEEQAYTDDEPDRSHEADPSDEPDRSHETDPSHETDGDPDDES